jgi:hypothetical protein
VIEIFDLGADVDAKLVADQENGVESMEKTITIRTAKKATKKRAKKKSPTEIEQ